MFPGFFLGLYAVSNPQAHSQKKAVWGDSSLWIFKATGPGHTSYIQYLVGLGQVDSGWCRWQALQADLLRSNLSSNSSHCWGKGQNQVPQAGGLESRNVCSPSTRGWKSKIKVTAGTVFPEASLFGMERLSSPVSSHGPPSV